MRVAGGTAGFMLVMMIMRRRADDAVMSERHAEPCADRGHTLDRHGKDQRSGYEQASELYRHLCGF